MDRGWTDNELYIEWLKECFEPETQKTQRGEYRMLLFDGHASHITSDAINFCEKKKIVLLYLPSHSTHLLQPLDVGVFSPFATAYKKGVMKTGRWGAQYSIDKIDFLKICQKARIESITEENVQSAWRKAGLFPYNPDLVLQELPTVKNTLNNRPPSRPTTAGGPAPLSIHTPVDITSVQAILNENRAIRSQLRGISSDLELYSQRLEKVCHTAISALTESKLIQATNADLIEAQKRIKLRGKRLGEKAGDARVLSKKTL